LSLNLRLNQNAAKEKTVAPQSVVQPASRHSTPGADAKAAMLEVNRGAVDRAAFIQTRSPALAERVASGEMPASSAILTTIRCICVWQ